MKTTIFLTLPCLVLFTLFAAGCNQQKTNKENDEGKKTSANQQHEGGHAHATTGSHGGEIYFVGNDVADIELKHDHDADQVTVWVSDHDGSAVDAGESITLQVFEDGKFVDYTFPKTDTPGMYQLTDKTLCDLLEESDHLKARLHVMIKGKKETAIIEHHSH